MYCRSIGFNIPNGDARQPNNNGEKCDIRQPLFTNTTNTTNVNMKGTVVRAVPNGETVCGPNEAVDILWSFNSRFYSLTDKLYLAFEFLFSIYHIRNIRAIYLYIETWYIYMCMYIYINMPLHAINIYIHRQWLCSALMQSFFSASSIPALDSIINHG